MDYEKTIAAILVTIFVMLAEYMLYVYVKNIGLSKDPLLICFLINVVFVVIFFPIYLTL